MPKKASELYLNDGPAKASRLFLVDGNSLAYRAYYALPEDFATSEGFPTGALFGFAQLRLPGRDARRQIRLFGGLGQPLQKVMPVPQIVLRAFERGTQRTLEPSRLRVGLGAIA